MRVLIVAATELEIAPLKTEVKSQSQIAGANTADIRFLVTGVGMVATSCALSREFALHQYDLAINLGIAGSFDRKIMLGEVVEIVEDSLSELGAEDDQTFLTIEELDLGESTYTPSASLSDLGKTTILKKVTAITVNTVHGHLPSIKKLTDRIQPQVESMEGAAFFYTCKDAGIQCLQIRAVSNYVEKRNRAGWEIGLAIKNLNTFAIDLFRQMDGR
jgi:futalosine hydrolase